MNDNTLLLFTLASAILIAACGTGTEMGSGAIRLTAADLADGRPLVDLTGTEQWIIDGRESSIDLSAIDVETSNGVEVLDDWLARESELDREQIDALAASELKLWTHPAPSSAGGIGSSSQALRAAPCTANICCVGCDPPGTGGDSSCCVWHPRPEPRIP